MGKQPPAVELITGWWKDEFFEQYAEGNGIETWHDYSGNAGDFTQATEANRPELFPNARHGAPSLRFGDAASVHYMTGPDCDTLFNAGTLTLCVSFYVSQVDTEQYLFCDETGSDGRIALSIIPTADPLRGELRGRLFDGAVNQIAIGDGAGDPWSLTPGWHWGCMQHVGGNLRVYLDDPLYFRFIACGNTSAFGLARVGADPTGARPLLGDDATYGDAHILEIIASDAAWNEANLSTIYAYMAGRVLERGEPLEIARKVASQHLLARHRARQKHTIGVPIFYRGKSEIMTPYAMSHQRVPDPRGPAAGAGLERWSRKNMILRETVEDLDNYSMSLLLEERLDLHYYESGVSKYSGDPRRTGDMQGGIGVYRFNGGGTTQAFFESPTDGVVETVPPGVEGSEAAGLGSEPAQNQLELRSSFVSGFTGITDAGGGGGGASVIDADPPHVFRVASLNKAKFTAGNPHTADYYREWPLTIVEEPIAADERLCFSLDHRGAGGDWWFQNNFDSNWWDDTNLNWNASPVPNAVPASVDPDVYERWRSNVIRWPAGGSGRGVLRVGLRSGGVALREWWVGHVQLETGGFPTARMVQDASFVGARGARGVGWSDFGDHPLFPVRFFKQARGTFGFLIRSPWSAADLEAGKSTIPGGYVANLFNIQNAWPPSSHYWVIRYNAGLGAGLSRWEFAVKATGAEDIAFHDETALKPGRYATRRVFVRVTSATEGELGLPANTIDIFVGDGVTPATKGTTAQVFTRPTENVDARIQTGFLASRVRRIFSTSRVMPDEWIYAESIR